MKKFSSIENGLIIIFVLALIGLVFAPPITQSQDYHRFADGRTMLGINNAMNVFSNIYFLLGGWFCISLMRHNKLIAAYRGQEKFISAISGYTVKHLLARWYFSDRGI